MLGFRTGRIFEVLSSKGALEGDFGAVGGCGWEIVGVRGVWQDRVAAGT